MPLHFTLIGLPPTFKIGHTLFIRLQQTIKYNT